MCIIWVYVRLLECPHSFALVSVPRPQDDLIIDCWVVDGIGPRLGLQTHSSVLGDWAAVFTNVGAVQEVASVELYPRLV